MSSLIVAFGGGAGAARHLPAGRGLHRLRRARCHSGAGRRGQPHPVSGDPEALAELLRAFF